MDFSLRGIHKSFQVLGQLPPRNIASWMIASGLLLPDNYSKDNCPLTISPRKWLPKKIAFRMICRLHNCPSGKWPPGKLSSRKIVPKINYTRYIFSPKIRSRITLIDSCFSSLIDSSSCIYSLCFNLVLDFDFCIRKNFMNTVRLKLL